MLGLSLFLEVLLHRESAELLHLHRSVCFAGCSSAERKALQVVSCPRPFLEDINSSRCLRRFCRTPSDSSHPSHLVHYLFEMLTSRRRYRALKSNRLKNSFYPRAVMALKSWTTNCNIPENIIITNVQYCEQLVLRTFKHLIWYTYLIF